MQAQFLSAWLFREQPECDQGADLERVATTSVRLGTFLNDRYSYAQAFDLMSGISDPRLLGARGLSHPRSPSGVV